MSIFLNTRALYHVKTTEHSSRYVNCCSVAFLIDIKISFSVGCRAYQYRCETLSRSISNNANRCVALSGLCVQVSLNDLQYDVILHMSE